MKVLFVASECTPFIKTGGLADVIGTLPKALAENEQMDIRVILPKYRDIPDYWKSRMRHLLYFNVHLGWRSQYCGIEYIEMDGVTYYFIDNEFYFGRDGVYGEGDGEGERFAFFCRAVLDAIAHLGFRPDVIHTHDWQAGMVCALHKTQYMHDSFYQKIKTVFTIHNLRYQGLFDWGYISDLLGLSDRSFSPDMLEYYGKISFMKGGLVFADHLSTVSPTYAQEIQEPFFGEGLDGMIRARAHQLSGIMNGIDPQEYNPEDDMWLGAHFSAEDMAGKKECKRILQEELYLEQRENVPLISIISRLCDQKGFDLIERVLDEIMDMDVQFVVLGKGDEHFQEFFSWAAWRYQGRMATRIELNNPLAHQIYAGSDMFLMPSAFEPCGLSQMISMRFGTIPVVRETGGLKDSIIPYNQFTGEGDGFSFANYNAHEMLFKIQEAVALYNNKEIWSALQHRAMAKDFSWEKSALEYISMYEEVLKA